MSALPIKRISIAVVVLLLAGCAPKVSVPYEQKSFSKLQDQKLKESILLYYSYLKDKKLDKLYQMESPSFRYLYPLEKFEAYYRGFKPIKKIIFLDAKEISPNVYESRVKLILPDVSVVKEDTWVKIDSRLYHNTTDPFFFPE